KVGPIKIPKYPICKHVCRLVSVSSFYVTFFFASSPAAIRHPPSAIRLSEFIQRRSVSGIFIPSSMSSSKSETEPPILSLALPSGTGRVLSIQSHTVQFLDDLLDVYQSKLSPRSCMLRVIELLYEDCPFPGMRALIYVDLDSESVVSIGSIQCYPSFKGQVLNGQQLWELIEGLEANNLLFYTHLLTGYIGSVSFLNTVLEVVNKLRTINPKLTYVCDPVMGDEGKLYVPVDLVAVYREKVVPVASMLTPNQFEAEQLTGSRIVSESDGRSACNKLHAAGPSKVVLTSINIGGGLLLIGSDQKEKGQPPQQFKIAIPKIPAYFTKYPDNLDKAAELAVSSLQALLQRTVIDYQKAGYDPAASSLEIRLIQSQDDIRNPNVQFKAEKYS
ncbi:Pyridoxal kinase, partial [Linum grandiflorum]